MVYCSATKPGFDYQLSGTQSVKLIGLGNQKQVVQCGLKEFTYDGENYTVTAVKNEMCAASLSGLVSSGAALY